MRSLQLVTILVVQILAVGAVVAECDHGSVRTAGAATSATPPDTLTLSFEIEIESGSFARAKAAGDSLRERLEGLQAQVPAGATITVGYDFGILGQKRLAWSGGKKLQYEFVVTITGISEGAAQEVLVTVVDSAVALDPKLIVQEIDASLSPGLAARVRAQLLRDAVASARLNANVIADAAELGVLDVSSVAMAEASPTTAVYGFDFDGNILGRSYQDVLVLHRRFSVDAGVPDIELTGAVVATFCVAPG